MLNWIFSITYQYLETFNCMQINQYYWIEYFVLDSNTCNHLSVYKQLQYLILSDQISSKLFNNKITNNFSPKRYVYTLNCLPIHDLLNC